MNIFNYQPDSILTLDEISLALQLDQHIVKRIALRIGGRRFGSQWRFRWGTVMEYFQNANFKKRSRECIACQSCDQRGDCGQQVFPARADKWPGMAWSQNMGGGKEKGAAARQGKEGEDPFGLRNILGLG